MDSRFPALPGHKPKVIDESVPLGWKVVFVFLQLIVLVLGAFAVWMFATDMFQAVLEQFRDYGYKEGIPFAVMWFMGFGCAVFLFIGGLTGPVSHRWFWTKKPFKE